MLTLRLADGRIVQRVFAGFVNSATDLERVVNELRGELAENPKRMLMAELWIDVTPRSRFNEMPFSATRERDDAKILEPAKARHR